MGPNRTTTNVLEGLAAEIVAADPDSKEQTVQVGVELEEAAGAFGTSSEGPGQILSLALEVLQAVHQDDVSDASAAMGAVAGAVVAVAEHVSDEGGESGSVALEEAETLLRSILEGRTDESAAGPAKPEEPVAPVSKGPAEAPDVLPADADPDLMKEFIVECLDHISAAEAALLELEASPDEAEPINTVFRAFHTIKGTSSFLGLDRIQKVAHLAESLLDRAREGEIKVTGGYADLALKSCDTLRTMIEALEGVQPGGELLIPAHYDELMSQLADPEGAGISDEAVVEEMRVGDILVGKQRAEREKVEEAARQQGDRRIGEVLIEKKDATATDVAKALRTQKKITGPRAAEATVRVGTGRLDNLVNMVGELVIAQSMIAQDRAVIGGENARLAGNITHSGKIIRELQDLTVALRMVPLKGTFQKMARLVRDLARKADKEVRFITEGEETEIDRNMVEVLNDPLVHMVRNAVDHGIEPADRRKQAGKDPSGTVRLKAYHAAGNIVIELQDDGKGLDRQRIVAKAVGRGLIDAGRYLTDGEAYGLIFQPGFSTAEKVTDVSGRGVGLDVVKKGIESLRGRVDVVSEAGLGSTFTLRLPLTMAITDAMLLRLGPDRYLLPTASIEHSFRPAPGSVSSVTGRGEMVMLRGDLLPMFRLHELFNVSGAVTDPYEGLLIAIEGEGRRYALMVDELLGQQQVVIKSLGNTMGNIRGVAGGAILGDGRVGLILDAAGVLKLALGRDGAYEPVGALD